MSADWRPKPQRAGKKATAMVVPLEPMSLGASEWRPKDVAPAGKFRVVTFGRQAFEEPTSVLVGDFDALPFAKQHAIELNRQAVLTTRGEIRSAWVVNDAGAVEFNPYAGRASNSRPMSVTSLSGLQREESRKKPVTPIKRK